MLNEQKLDAKAVERLRKTWAMRGSEHAGERENAEAAALRIVEPFGYVLADAPDLLSTPARSAGGQHAPGGQPWGLTFCDINNPDHMAAWAEHDRMERRARARQEAPERAEVIHRYGGLEPVLAWTDRERLLRAAVAQWSEFQDPPHRRWTKSIDGYATLDSGNAPKRVLRALSEAYPLPVTITAAAAEYESWGRRNRDIGLALEDTSESHLDLPLYLRQRIVGDLLETGLRAASVAEVLLRQQHMMNQDFPMPEVEAAVLEDLKHLAALEAKANVQNGRATTAEPVRTATERRAEVVRLLSNLDTAGLSDREIARRVGVSPQTVGNIRRRMQAA